MKKWFTFFSLMIAFWHSTAQTGIGTTTPNAAAKLEIAATDKGILIPRMTKTQRESITLATAANGLLVYQTDDVFGFYVNSSTTTTPSWTRLNSDWIKSGNNISYTAGNVSTTGALTGGNSDTSSISGFTANITSVAANYSLNRLKPSFDFLGLYWRKPTCHVLHRVGPPLHIPKFLRVVKVHFLLRWPQCYTQMK